MRRSISAIWLSAHVIGASVAATAESYYVATDGDDTNPGTLDAPWASVQKAAETLMPGDTAHVRGGVYAESVTVRVSGSAEGDYVTFRNFGSEVPVLDGATLDPPADDNGMVLIVDESYVRIEGFEIRNYSTTASEVVPVGIHVRGSAHHIDLVNNQIHHIATLAEVDDDLAGADAHGIAVYGSAEEPIHDLLIEGNELHDLTLGSSEGLVVNGNVDGFTVRGNRIHALDNIAIDIIGFEETGPNPDLDQARNGVISDNLVYNVSSFGNPAYGDDYSAGGIYVDGGRDITIERNTIYDTDIGIELASEHAGRSTSGITVRNNLLYNNRLTGLAMGGYDRERGSTEDCIVVNNTLYHNDGLQDGNGELLIQFDTRNNVIANNIFFANDQGWLIANDYSENEGNTVDYNLYFSPIGDDSEWLWREEAYQGFATYAAATGNDAHSLFTDPGFVDPELPDFHLSTGSAAVDAGAALFQVGATDMDGGERLQGDGVDIGADEATVEDDTETDVDELSRDATPASFALHPNYPNPFNSGTVIRFELPTELEVELTFHDLAGQTVMTRLRGRRPGGSYALSWDGRDADGRELASGVYVYRLRAGEHTQQRKLLLLR